MPDPVLMVLTAASELELSDGSIWATGYWASEVVEPHEVLTGAGYDVVIATPGGVQPTPDPRSVKDPGIKDRLERIGGLREPLALSQVATLERYAAVVLPGGHGPMADLCGDPHMGRIVREAVTTDTPIAAICHGPAGLLPARQDPDATWPFSGLALTAFSDAEEGERAGLLRWSLEQELRACEAKLELADEPFAEKVVVDGLLVTGQNPASARPAAQALVRLLAARG